VIGIVERGSRYRQGPWCPLLERAKRAVIVVLSDVLDQYVLEMSAPEDEESIGALSADGADEPLGETRSVVGFCLVRQRTSQTLPAGIAECPSRRSE
jgi:hypothetical protein